MQNNKDIINEIMNDIINDIVSKKLGYWYDKSFMCKQEADELYTFCSDLNFVEYPYRGKTLTRSPKVEFKINNTIGTYRFGQEKKAYDLVNLSIPDIIQKHINKLNDKNINYVTIIKYDHGTRHHIPWHSDKQEGTISAGAKDITGGTNIYNINVFNGINRLFQVAKPEFIDKTKASVYEFNERMEHGSLFALTADGNKTMKHQVPKEKKWTGCRYSIVLRTIKNNKK